LADLLSSSFFDRDVVEVARGLLGMRLVRLLDEQRVGGTIVEAEAYRGEEDLACHARHGLTPRTAVMYGPPGRAYVYFTYGMHWMLNCVASPIGFPAAVLVRAIRPLEGRETVANRRPGRAEAIWCNGPGKVTQALGIDGGLNGVDLTSIEGNLWIESGSPIPDEQVAVSPRIGLGSTPEPWLSMPWRFKIR
jgi:DNA-3-methyladenine glycosylase